MTTGRRSIASLGAHQARTPGECQGKFRRPGDTSVEEKGRDQCMNRREPFNTASMGDG